MALLKSCHDELVKLPFEKLIHALRNFPDEVMDPDTLLPLAYSMKISKRLEELRFEYEKTHGKPGQSIESRRKEKQPLERHTSSRARKQDEKQNGEAIESEEVTPTPRKQPSLQRHYSHRRSLREHHKLDGEVIQSNQEMLQRRDSKLMARNATS